MTQTDLLFLRKASWHQLKVDLQFEFPQADKMNLQKVVIIENGEILDEGKLTK